MENITNTTSPAIPIEAAEPCNSGNVAFISGLFSFACVIVLILAFLEKRNNRERCGRLRGHPGLVIPVNLLDHNYDRISFSAAFGSMASVCFNLMAESNLENIPVPAWCKVLYIMALVVLIGLLYYPVFACLSTKRMLVGNFLGAAFTTCLFAYNLKIVVNSAVGANELDRALSIVPQLPVLICLCFLIMRFVWKFIHHTYLTVKRGDAPQEEEKRLSEPHNVSYVKNLLYMSPYTIGDDHRVVENRSNMQAQDKIPFNVKKISSMMYKNDPLFKYSPKIIAIFSVAIICVYQISVQTILVAKWIIDNSQKATTIAGIDFKLFLKVLAGCILLSFIVSLLLTIWSTFQILSNYRLILKAMFKGNFKAFHFKRSDFKAQMIMSHSLCYAGSQIAYILWGYIVSNTIVAITCLLITYLVILPLTGDVPFIVFKYSVLNILPGLVIMRMFRFFQSLWSRLLLQKADFVDDDGQPTTKRVLALNNRKAYHIVSFFLFLFYIVLGIFGCLLTISKGIVLGVVYLSRLDRCRLMHGYESLDRAYLYFISFMYMEESHRHPVLLVFCDMMLEKHRINKRVDLENVTSSVTNPHSSFDSLSTVSRSLSTTPRARLRWLKSYTLIRNPSLIVDKEHGFAKDGQNADLRDGPAPDTLLM